MIGLGVKRSSDVLQRLSTIQCARAIALIPNRTEELGQRGGTSRQTTLAAVDSANLAGLERIVAQFGFPTVAMVGRDGVQSAWLLVQRADTDLAFQKRVLAILRARANDVVSSGELAMLEDRIRVHEGKPQLYGSNFDLHTLQPTPIEDPEHVDERRARVHLMPMADYRCLMRHIYRATK